MKMIKFLILCLVWLSFVLSSCNHKSEKLYQTLPIVMEYKPVEYVFDRGEISKEELNKMPNLMLVINSKDEYPEENLMGLEELKESDIDFKKHTLLLSYYKIPGVVLGYKYQYVKDFENDVLILFMSFRLDHELYENPETENLFTYYRSAFLVSKVPQDTEVKFSLSY